MALNAVVDKVVSHLNNMGIGAAFMTGMRNSFSMGADIVVNHENKYQTNRSVFLYKHF